MIKWLIKAFMKPEESPYSRGRNYAWSELQKHGWEAEERLYAESDGVFNATHSEREFDRGVQEMIRDFDAQQREIVKNMQEVMRKKLR